MEGTSILAALEAVELSWGEVAARLGVALLVGFVVGLEREIEGKDAGVRTHMLLALGAAVFGVVSVGGFSDFVAPRNDTNINIDVTRVASYVAAGIGFLGGGTIIKSRHRIHGLTTAASLWVVAGAGLAAGVGLYEAALLGGIMAALVLVADRPISWITGHLRPAVEATEGHPISLHVVDSHADKPASVG